MQEVLHANCAWTHLKCMKQQQDHVDHEFMLSRRFGSWLHALPAYVTHPGMKVGSKPAPVKKQELNPSRCPTYNTFIALANVDYGKLYAYSPEQAH